MRNAFWHFGFIGGVISLLAATAGASTPTFSLKLAGINGEIFRDTECVTDDHCPDGSPCVLTEVDFPGNFKLRCGPISEVRLKCVGGSTPGVACDSNADCGGLGVCAGLVAAGDELAVESYLGGWDQEPDTGVCNNGDDCVIAENDCTQRHCSLSGQLCNVDGNCPEGQTCDEDDCAEGPLLGAYQWTVDCTSYHSLTNPHAGAFAPTLFACSTDEECHHDYIPGQCTCTSSDCNLVAGLCDLRATAYFELINFLYVYRDFSHEKLISTNTCNYQYAGAASRGGKPDVLEDKYAGTLRLQVPDNAMGTYMVDFEGDINFTFANDSSAHRFPAPMLNPLIIELLDPCAGFECLPPPNPCSEYVCQLVEGAPECVRQPVDCEPGQRCIRTEGGCVDVRACCEVDLTCTISSELECEILGGVWHDTRPTCEPTPCVPIGACCVDGNCSMTAAHECTGDYRGDDVLCSEVTCPAPGACCFDDGTCQELTADHCAASGGDFWGDGVLCSQVECPQPGACCIGQDCSQRLESDCNGAGGDFKGEEVPCEAGTCDVVGACCADDGGCTMETQTDCDSAGGVYQNDGVLCSQVTCPLPGACCIGQDCSQRLESDCNGAGGDFQGEDVPCEAETCTPPHVTLLGSSPSHDGTLWRSIKNITRLTFDGDLPGAPTAGEIEINELLPGGLYGPDLSSSFDMTVEGGTVLRIQDTGETLEHRKWYGIRNIGGWSGVQDFMVHYLLQMGDCDGNGLVISLDVGCVNAGIPCFVNCGDDNRKDINGDGRVISLDVGVVNGHIGSFTVPKPSGH